MAKPAVQIVMTVLTIELVGFARDQRLQSYDPRSRSPLARSFAWPLPVEKAGVTANIVRTYRKRRGCGAIDSGVGFVDEKGGALPARLRKRQYRKG